MLDPMAREPLSFPSPFSNSFCGLLQTDQVSTPGEGKEFFPFSLRLSLLLRAPPARRRERDSVKFDVDFCGPLETDP